MLLDQGCSQTESDCHLVVLYVTQPDAERSRPASTRNKLVLPAPEGPLTNVMLPFSKLAVTPRSTSTFSNRKDRCSAHNIGSPEFQRDGNRREQRDGRDLTHRQRSEVARRSVVNCREDIQSSRAEARRGQQHKNREIVDDETRSEQHTRPKNCHSARTVQAHEGAPPRHARCPRRFLET